MSKNISIDSIRNLPQYRGFSEDELEEAYRKILERKQSKEDKDDFNIRIKNKMSELGEDYDISDLKYNDRMQLEDLAVAIVTLEDLQIKMYDMQLAETTSFNIGILEKMSRVISNLRSDISKLQDDLKLSRKIRKSDNDENVVSYIENLKKRARVKYDKTMMYVYCPKCKMLVSTMWFLYPDEDNKLTFTCHRNISSDDAIEYCNNKFTVTSRELLKLKGQSEKGIFPG